MNYTPLLLLALIAISCNEKKTRGDIPYSGLPAGMKITPNSLPANNGKEGAVQFGQVSDTSANPLLKGQHANVQNPATNLPVQTSSSKNLNPAHGQPGHRCDLAVGAPLGEAPTLPTQTSNTLPVTKPQVAKTEPGKNPAHGQPGHRCDIAVGAPLNSTASKPVSNSTNNNATTAPVQPTTTPKLTTATDTNGAGGVAKLNPPHGQPGHDCSIAAGKPLKKQ